MPDKKYDDKELLAEKMENALAFTMKDSELTELIVEIDGKNDEAINDRSSWNSQLRDNYLWRMGQVARPNLNIPFRGSSDIRYRMSDDAIREHRPKYITSLLHAPRIVVATPLSADKQESSDKLEHYYDFLYRGPQMNLLDKASELADRIMSNGRGLVKTTWEYRCDPKTNVYDAAEATALRSMVEQKVSQLYQSKGVQPPELTDEQFKVALADWLKLDAENDDDKKKLDDVMQQITDKEEVITVIQDEEINRVRVEVITEIQAVIVSAHTTNIQDAEWISHDLLFSEDQLRGMSEKNGGKYRHVEELLELKQDSEMNREMRTQLSEKYRVEGLSSITAIKGHITVREHYCWLPKKHLQRWKGTKGTSERPVRCVVTYAPTSVAGMPIVLRMIEYPYQWQRSGLTWPFFQFTYDYRENRYYAHEGIPDILNPYEREFNISQNAAINRRTITLTPPILAHEESGITGSAFRQIGQVIQTGMIPPNEAVKVMQYPDLSSGFEFDAAKLEAQAHRKVGIQDLSSLPTGEAPSATQVEAVQAPPNAVTLYNLMHWHAGWMKVFTAVHELHRQYAFSGDGEKLEVPSVEDKKTFVKLTKADFEGEYRFAPGGDVASPNPFLDAQKWFGFVQMVTGNPKLAPYFKIYDVLRQFASKWIGQLGMESCMNDRKQAEQLNQQFMQMSAQAQAQIQAGKKPSGGGKQIKALATGKGGVFTKPNL